MEGGGKVLEILDGGEQGDEVFKNKIEPRGVRSDGFREHGRCKRVCQTPDMMTQQEP